jgi:hypothetical protein
MGLSIGNIMGLMPDAECWRGWLYKCGFVGSGGSAGGPDVGPDGNEKPNDQPKN